MEKGLVKIGGGKKIKKKSQSLLFCVATDSNRVLEPVKSFLDQIELSLSFKNGSEKTLPFANRSRHGFEPRRGHPGIFLFFSFFFSFFFLLFSFLSFCFRFVISVLLFVRQIDEGVC